MSKKQNLDGYYCKTSKKAYKQLIKDGYEDILKKDGFGYEDGYDYIIITRNNKFDLIGTEPVESQFKPMHLHNNEWVFGSLEPITEDDYEISEHSMSMHKEIDDYIKEHGETPKPIKHITKEEAFAELEKYVITSISSKERKHININVAKRVVTEIFDQLKGE